MTPTPLDTTPTRLAAARELTRLLEEHRSFSFLRLGDGEVQWMREVQAGREPSRYRYEAGSRETSIETVRGVTGMEARHYDRFLAAMDGCDYLDRCDSIPVVQQEWPTLGINRAPHAWGNETPETSNIIFEWTAFELGPWLATHHCVIAGAEAVLLRELWAEPDYQKAAAETLRFSRRPHFHQVRDNGKGFSENLDLIKEDLRREIERSGADTLLLSLASGAKVLCYELAREMGIRALDFGSMIRGLCYAGSSGYQSHRDMHSPFFFHVPFATHMKALDRAFPGLKPAEVLAKAHAQLSLELHRHRRFTFNTTEQIDEGGFDPSPENLQRFRQAWKDYRSLMKKFGADDAELNQLDKEFRFWLMKKEIGWKGRWFRMAVKAKAVLRRMMGRV